MIVLEPMPETDGDDAPPPGLRVAGIARWAIVALMAIALMLTIVLGLVLALRTLRPPWLVWLSLALGILVPVLCLWLGQQH